MDASMMSLLRCFRVFGLAFLLGGCVERTVTSTESHMGFAQGWAQQAGDTDKIRKKFSSGFEIKNGVAVASNGKKDMEPKAMTPKTIETKDYNPGGKNMDTGKTFATSMFNRTPELKTSTVKDEKKMFATHSADGMDKEFATKDARENGKNFQGASKAAREDKREFFGGKRAAREDSVKITPARADVVLEKSTGVLKRDPAALSEEQVRDILNPGSKEKE